MNLWIVLVCTVLIELWVLRRLEFDGYIVATVLAGTFVCVDYLSYTSISERNYDGPSHVEYIQSIAQHLRLPDVFACGACGHPPLYYALAALWSRVALVGGWIPFELGLQWLSEWVAPEVPLAGSPAWAPGVVTSRALAAPPQVPRMPAREA